jgi:hypothetical protein
LSRSARAIGVFLALTCLLAALAGTAASASAAPRASAAAKKKKRQLPFCPAVAPRTRAARRRAKPCRPLPLCPRVAPRTRAARRRAKPCRPRAQPARRPPARTTTTSTATSSPTTGTTTNQTAPAATPTSTTTSSPSALFSDSFNAADGLLTNHYAFWNPADPNAFRSPDWEMESGSVYRQSGTAWTGVPSDIVPNLSSSTGSGSQIFRLWTKRSDFNNVRVEMDLRNNGFTGGGLYPAVSWDGVKLWLRRQGASGSVGLYTAEVNRRQGNVMIQKKCAGISDYSLLGQTASNSLPARIGQWERVGGTVRTNADGSVTLQVLRNGAVVLEATDRGAGCAPITSAGKVGVRGDNADFNFDNFTVSAA